MVFSLKPFEKKEEVIDVRNIQLNWQVFSKYLVEKQVIYVNRCLYLSICLHDLGDESENVYCAV